MSLSADNRGLAVGIFVFAAMIIIAGLFFTIMNPVIDSTQNTTENATTSTQATDQMQLARAIWDNILFVGLGLAGLFIIVRAVFEQRTRGGR